MVWGWTTFNGEMISGLGSNWACMLCYLKVSEQDPAQLEPGLKLAHSLDTRVWSWMDMGLVLVRKPWSTRPPRVRRPRAAQRKNVSGIGFVEDEKMPGLAANFDENLSESLDKFFLVVVHEWVEVWKFWIIAEHKKRSAELYARIIVPMGSRNWVIKGYVGVLSVCSSGLFFGLGNLWVYSCHWIPLFGRFCGST